ncbi:MAG: tRNA (guanine(46)-N(7))-methyltransferase TrmB, partial [Rhodospirillales bacterium]|nr:tRNA (guanine(46)-N(7))-methyltransferase TrmB [Rhodospirillales bacterium]
GCEPFINGVASLLSHIETAGLKNVRVYDDDARDVLEALPDGSLDRLFILFPDPWPKARHHKRRLIGPGNLDLLARVLADGAELRFGSDHMDYVRWALWHLLEDDRFEWLARRPGDWRVRPDDWPPTRYEEKALAKGDACVFLRFRRRPR